MKPFIIYYAQKQDLDNDPLLLDYSEELSLSVVSGTNDPAIGLVASNLNTFTKAGQEPTDYNAIKSSVDGATFTRSQETTDANRVMKAGEYLRGETYTLDNKEGTDYNTHISRIAKRMSLETLTESRESTDAR